MHDKTLLYLLHVSINNVINVDISFILNFSNIIMYIKQDSEITKLTYIYLMCKKFNIHLSFQWA
jgi:hypothetical protein